jgi:hypothetical protein
LKIKGSTFIEVIWSRKTPIAAWPGNAEFWGRGKGVSERRFDSTHMQVGDPEVQEFQQALMRAGGLSHPALRAWARAKFHTDLLVTARVRQSTRKVSEQDLGRADIQKALHGVEQAEVHIALEVQDLRAGDHVTVVTGKGEVFTLDRTQSTQKARTAAVTEVVKKLRLWAHG